MSTPAAPGEKSSSSRSPFPEHDQITAILAAQGRQRAHLLDDFMRAKLQVFKSIAKQLCRTNSLDFVQHVDDMTGLVATECVAWLNEIIADPARLKQIRRSFDGVLFLRCRPVAKSYADGPAGGKASGAVALARRVREANRTREELRGVLEREPTAVEVVTTTNERMRALRKDPERQSMILSMDDLKTNPTTFSLDHRPGADWSDPGLGAHDIAAKMPEDGLIASHEAIAAICGVVRAADTLGAPYGHVARAWLGGLYDPEVQEIRTPSEVGRMLGLPAATVTRAIERLRLVGRSYLADILLVTEDMHHGAAQPPSAISTCAPNPEAA